MNRRFLALASLLVLGGCELDPTQAAQTALIKAWTNPTVRIAIEGTAEKAIQKNMESTMIGRELDAPGPNCVVQDVEWVQLDLGNKPPDLKFTGQGSFWQSPTHYYLRSTWKLVWPKGSQTKLDFRLNLTGASWWMIGYPDHTFHVRDIEIVASGHLVASVSKTAPYKLQVTRGIDRIETDMKTSGEGWFWTIDVTSMFKKTLQKVFLDKIVGKSVESSFTWAGW